jgi:hypothetical protein
LIVYLLLLLLTVGRANIKYGPETAVSFAMVGLLLLLVLSRAWGYVLGIIAGWSSQFPTITRD